MALFNKPSPESVFSSPLTLDQARRLLMATQKRKPLHAMLMIALHGGLGKDEVLLLKKSDIDFVKNTIIFSKPKRELAFSPNVITSVSEAIQAQTFTTDLAFPFSESVVKKTLNDLGSSVLGCAISWSTLRKSWAVFCGEQDVKLESMVYYSGSTYEALARWTVYGKQGKELPVDFLD